LNQYPWRFAAILFVCSAIAAVAMTLIPVGGVAAPRPKPSPSASPTAAPTPFMPLEEIPNGSWDVIEQSGSIAYTRMTLKEVGNAVTGLWYYDKNKSYVLDGQRQGAHLTLQIKASSNPDAAVIGKIEADIDGIADMIGSITLGATEVPFQGAQHGRVPAPVDNNDNTTPAPEATY
jgi:hypothetical protein